jgi:tetratricopeptide (TPR) repeat protein
MILTRCVPSLGVLLLVSASRADEVIYTDPQGTEVRRTGEIVDYTGERLMLRGAGGEWVVPSSRVVRVESPWNAPHQEAIKRFAQGKYDLALASYRAALAEEQRGWVRRRILADAIWCDRNLGNVEEACASFLTLSDDDHQTQYFAAIPLAWRPYQPDVSLERRARDWLGSQNPPVASLMGASWLLSTSARPAAIDALQRLARHPDERIRVLARAQLWRTQLVQMTKDRVEDWQQDVERMPVELRAGPYYVLGRAHARLQHHDQAALALLRVPLLYPQERELSGDALLGAAEALARSGAPDDAVRLYQQLIDDHPASAAAQQAAAHLQKLRQP